MSSIIDRNINLNCLENKRTITVSINLATSSTKIVDLTNCKYGQLDFKPDFVTLKYIAYTSCGNAPADNMPILTCDFLQSGNLLGPFLAQTGINPFSFLEYRIKQSVDIQKATFQTRIINDEQEEIAYDSGTLLVSLEFKRYRRFREY